MIPTTDFIAAIELGSSKIAGIAGKKGSDGSIQVLAYVSEPSSSFIRKGVILNLDKTAQALTSIINQLESKLDCGIAKVYVGISGQSLHSETNVIVRELKEETIITQEMVDSIYEENANLPLVDKVILDVVPQEYKIGFNYESDPVGVAAKHIEGNFLNILSRTSVKKLLNRSFDQAKLKIADLFISPMALAQVVLSDGELKSGCALVDFGADTTTVAIYKSNILRFLTVIPLGGNSITQDITSLQVEEDEAEEIKKKYGKALTDEVDDRKDEKEPILLQDGTKVLDPEQLCDIIEARAEEIIVNVVYQIEQLSGYRDKLHNGIVLTGGGVNLKRIEDLFRQKSQIQRIRVAKAIKNEIVSPQGDILRNGRWNTLLGLLYAGDENCAEVKQPEKVAEPEPEPEPELRQETTPHSTSLFGNDENYKAEEDRREKIRRDKEEEKRRKKAEKDAARRRKQQEEEGKPKWYEKIGNIFLQEDDDLK